METMHPTDHTTINLYKVEDGIKADIVHNYGKYTFEGEIKENIGYETILVKTDNMSYAKRKAKEHWSKYF
jgi:hypothetical protein